MLVVTVDELLATLQAGEFGRVAGVVEDGAIDFKSAPYPLAALRWHGRFSLEARTLTLAEAQLALSALVAMGDGDAEAVDVLRRLLRKTRPTVVPRFA